MNKQFLQLIIFVDILKRKTIFLKNNFVSFAASILMIIDKYLILFVHLLTITRIALYTNLSRLLNDKSIMKFIKKNFQNISDTDKEFNFLQNL